MALNFSNPPTQWSGTPVLIRTLLFSGMVMLFSAGNLMASTQLTLVTEEIPPLQIKVNHEAKGYVVEFIQELIEEANTQQPMEISDIQFLPWKRAILRSKETNVLFFSISRSAAREDMYHWIGEISPYEVMLYKHVSGPDIAPDSLEELVKYRLGCQGGGNFERFFKSKGFTPITVSFNRQTIGMLSMGHIDYAPQLSSSFFYRLEELGIDPDNFKPVIRVNELSRQLWLVASKGTSLPVVNALRQAYDKLTRLGRLRTLQQAYHPDSPVMTQYRQEKNTQKTKH